MILIRDSTLGHIQNLCKYLHKYLYWEKVLMLNPELGYTNAYNDFPRCNFRLLQSPASDPCPQRRRTTMTTTPTPNNYMNEQILILILKVVPCLVSTYFWTHTPINSRCSDFNSCHSINKTKEKTSVLLLICY